jgi:uncharacterized protein (DUF302 family)
LAEEANSNGIIQLESEHSFEDTLKQLESVVSSRGLTIFAKIDFSGDAAREGLWMNPTQMIIFGNPKAGTPLMVASPTIAIDFPLKILVSEDEVGKVVVSYNSIEYLRDRHHISENLLKNILGIVQIAESVTH